MRILIAGLMTALVSAACSSTPATLSQSDLDAIRSTSRLYVETALARDWAKWKTAFDAEAKFMPPNSPVLNGPEEIEKWGRAFPVLKSFTLEPLEIEGQSNTAWARGRYLFVADMPGGGEISDTGKYLEIWRRQADGSWKLYRDAFNSDQPLPAPPSPAEPQPKKR